LVGCPNRRIRVDSVIRDPAGPRRLVEPRIHPERSVGVYEAGIGQPEPGQPADECVWQLMLKAVA